MYILDIHGKQASTGSTIKVLKIEKSIFKGLSNHEIDSINSILNGVFKIEDVDFEGYAWIEKWWQKEDGSSYSHSIRLSAGNFELLIDQ